MNKEALILQKAREKGWNPSRLTPVQYRMLSLEVRTVSEAVRDVGKAGAAAVQAATGIRVVSLEQVEQNKKICENCPDGKFGRLEGNIPVCKECNCNGKFLEAKWKVRSGKCPLGHWANDGTAVPK